MKKILLYTFIAAASVFTTSCNDYLDCEPITSVSTNVYLYSETDLAAYAAKFYNDSEDEKDDEYGNILPSHGSATYNLGLFQKDNGTDDQTADSPSKLFVKGQYHVGDDDLWHKYFRKIRAANYFIQTVTERYTNREISGNDANIKHYIGEVYFFRAYIYLTALQNLGDFPILTEILPDDYNAIREASKRRPRNEVARFILSDLDKAYEYMLPTAPVSNRLNKDCAALVKSRAALFEATWEKYHKGSAFVPGGPGWPGASMDYLKDLTNSVCMLIHEGLEFRFSHRSFQEYFAALYTVQLSDSQQKRFLKLWLQDNSYRSTSNYLDMLYELQPLRFVKNIISPAIRELQEKFKKNNESEEWLIGYLYEDVGIRKYTNGEKRCAVTIKNFYYHDMIIRACSISELYNNSKQERMQRNKVREEKLIKILEEEYHASKPVRFEDIIRRGYTKEMLEALYWVIERYKFAVNYVDMVDKDPLAKKKRFSSMLEEL